MKDEILGALAAVGVSLGAAIVLVGIAIVWSHI